MVILYFVVGIIMGAILGGFCMGMVFHAGTFNVDTHNPEDETYRLTLEIPLEEIKKRKMMILDVNPNADLSK